jgi:hypothetical protein
VEKSPSEHLHEHFQAIIQWLAVGETWRYPYQFQDTSVGMKIAKLSLDEQALLLVSINQHLVTASQEADKIPNLEIVLSMLLSKDLPFTQANLLDFFNSFIDSDNFWQRDRISGYAYHRLYGYLPELTCIVDRYTKRHPLTDELRSAIAIICSRLEDRSVYYSKKIAELRVASQLLTIVLGEAWSDAAIAYLKTRSPSAQLHWQSLFILCLQASQSRPSRKWQSAAEAIVEQIGRENFCQAILKWFPLVDKARTRPIDTHTSYRGDPNLLIHEIHADILKGLVWLSVGVESGDIARALSALALSAYRRLPEIGERCVRLGNACVWALGQMSVEEALSQLAILKTKVKYGTAQKEIAKAMSEIAQRTGQSLEMLAEETVPTYGLSTIGQRQDQIGDFTASLIITDSKTVELRWHRPDGKLQKSVPKAVITSYASELKAHKRAIKDIKEMLLVQRDRLESIYLEPCTWDYTTWCQNYLNHPLIGTLAKRLIWQFRQQDKTTAAIWWQDQLITSEGHALSNLTPDTPVELWHPLGSAAKVSVDEVVLWRNWLLTHQVQQPFKQAYREVYLLTAAEKKTRTYSNRFAAHILKQYQFNALCKARSWKNEMIFPFDDSREFYSRARRQLLKQGLQAEFWIEAIADSPENDSAAMAYPYLTTNKVCFRTVENKEEMIPLKDIPPLVFSEVMRDIDLFVGVASIGSDPNWHPSNQHERYQAYWHDYSFGELSTVAATRHQLLEQLVPRLKIASCCLVTQRFLVVKGKLRTYKIHLGSGNILMESNDQYLCILPGRGSSTTGVFLPFEGDSTLAVILSKAFLLAEDDKIKDQIILSQIQLNRS